MTLIIAVRDLLFSSRIVSAAKEAGREFQVVRHLNKLNESPGEKLIIDLNQNGAVDAAVQWKRQHAGVVIGFVSHVDVDIIAAAKAAELDQVLSRGQFTQLVSSLIRA